VPAVSANGLKVAHLDTGRTWRGGQAQALLLMRELRARGVDQLLLAPPGPLVERALELEALAEERAGSLCHEPRPLDPPAFPA